MSSLHPHPRGRKVPQDLAARHACARRGCATCLEFLLHHHEPLIHFVLHDQWGAGLAYDDQVQEGRIALWRAIQHFDPTRGARFSSYAAVAIRHRLWLATFRAGRQCPSQAVLERLAADVAAYADEEDPYRGLDPGEQVERREPARLLLAAVQAVCDRSPVMWERALLAYGLDGRPEQSLRALGWHYGVSREYLRQCREQILVRLRVRLILCGYLAVCGRDTRATYQRFQALNRIAWRHVRYRQMSRRLKAAKAKARA